MKFFENSPPRKFKVGLDESIELKDYGKIFLEDSEQVTFVMENGKEHDFTAKSWGFYVTPSVNGRLKKFGLKTALIKNSFEKYYVVVVDPQKMEKFEDYLKNENQTVVQWLDEKIEF